MVHRDVKPGNLTAGSVPAASCVRAGARMRGFRILDADVTARTRLAIGLRMPGLEVEDPFQSVVWRGMPDAVQFGVHVPRDHPLGDVIGTVTVALDSAPVGHVKFRLALKEESPMWDRRSAIMTQAGQLERRCRRAFSGGDQ